MAALPLASCGSDDSSNPSPATDPTINQTSSTTKRDSTQQDSTEQDSTEQDSEPALTAASVVVDGTAYNISCTAISPSNLSDPLGQASYLGDDVAIRTLAGINVDNAIAIEVDGGACGPGEQQLSDWSLAIAQGVQSDLAQQIACESGLNVKGC